MDQALDAVPIILITGYLGSGKTTFLNRLLATSEGRRVAVLVNDFGAINVDEALVEGAVDGVVPLQNGCICCSLEGGLHAAITRVLKSSFKPEVILIEASGVSRAGELARILNDDAMRQFACLELIVTAFDCEYWQACNEMERDWIRSQLGYANVILLTKADLVTDDLLDAAHDVLKSEAPGAFVIRNPSVNITVDVLLGIHSERLVRPPQHAGRALQAHEIFRSWQVIENVPFTKAGFQSLLNNLPAQTVRGKGYIHLEEFPSRRFLFQMVGKRATVVPSGDWGTMTPQTSLVFIGLREAIGPNADFSFAS